MLHSRISLVQNYVSQIGCIVNKKKKKWILAQKSNFISKSIIYKIKHVGKVILRKK